jgi:hypothetical protein
MPELKSIRCTPDVSTRTLSDKGQAPDRECTISGDKLFLIDAISADPDFTTPVTIPDGFIEAALNVPAPKGKNLYIRLRDDPVTIDTVTIPTNSGQ